MPTRILIARHGNTFLPNETPRRIGAHTDLPLVEKEKSYALGQYLKSHHLLPTIVWASPLKRTMETAQLACQTMELDGSLIYEDHRFIEIDYGPDENKTEEEVKLRLGKKSLHDNGKNVLAFSYEQIKDQGQRILDAWNDHAIVPYDWKVEPQQYIDCWLSTGKEIEEKYLDQTVLIVSSNGVIRFSPYLTGNFQKFTATHAIKVSTGALCIFEKDHHQPHWHCVGWNIKPQKTL